MLNPSREASQWWEVTKLKSITGVVVQSKEEELSCKLRVDARNLELLRTNILWNFFFFPAFPHISNISLSFKDIVHKM
jgi:hypothetical protein